ncbi:MAG TPA: alpha/beta fold hydrolase [Thermoleophilaceae bacterium]
MNARDRLLAEIPAEERHHEAAGIATAFLEGGDGPPIVLLHGPGEFAAKWLYVIPGLVATNRVVAPDLPGHGESGVPDGELDAERVLDWLDELIARTCPEPPVLVGHVLGGAIAARYACRRGARLDRLVLVDSLGLAPFRPAPSFGLAMVRFLARPSERSYERFMRRCSHDLDALQAQMGELWRPFEDYNLEGARSPVGKAALRALMKKVGTPVIPPGDLANIAVPTALIWGRHDLAIRPRIAEAASARYGWPLHVVDGVADDPPRDAPEAFIEALRDALAEQSEKEAA